jgi:hypothetical protein
MDCAARRCGRNASNRAGVGQQREALLRPRLVGG